jgi:hypothetical protein
MEVRGGVRRKIQNLVETFLKCDQVPCNEFSAGAREFMRMADLEHLRQALVGIEADAVLVGNGDEHKVKKLFQTG